MRKNIITIVLLGTFFVLVPSTVMAALTPVRISSAYNSDSDGVSFFEYSIGTEMKNKPWNYSFSNIRIKQSDMVGDGSLSARKFTVRWQRPINEESGISAWAGYSGSDIWKFATFGAQYRGVVNYTDKMSVNYSRDSVNTIAAYKSRILSDGLSFRYEKELDRRLVLDHSVKYASYSDGNFRRTAGVALRKDFSPHYRLGLAYLYETSDLDKRSVFYLPKGESSISLVPEFAWQVGKGSVVLKMSKALYARNVDGNINRTSYGAEYQINNFSLGMQYSRDADYCARDYSFSWNIKW